MIKIYSEKMSDDVAPKLELLHTGRAVVDESWHGSAVRSQCSRLYYIKKGSFYVVSDKGKRTEFKEGGVYLIPSGYSYTYGCTSENEHLYFHIRLYGFDSIDLLGRFKEPTSCDVCIDIERLSKMIGSHGVTATLVITGEIYRAIAQLAVNSRGLLDIPIYSPAINSAINYISNNLSVKLSITEISETVRFARSTLSGKFRREVGMSIGEYIDYRIMLSASQKLISESLSIREISDFYGFSDQFYFSRRFKKSFGISPQQYRKNTFGQSY